MNKFRLLDIFLNLFDGGAGASGAGGAPTGTAEGAATQQGGSTIPTSNTRKSKTGALDNVVYGKPPSASSDAGNNRETDVKVTSNTLEEKNAAFDALINGEYKDLYSKRVQSIIDRRFKETKTLQEQLESQNPVIDALMRKYNVADVKKLPEALDKDQSFWMEQAENAGFPDVEAYKNYVKSEQELKKLKEAQAATEGREKAQNQMRQWIEEGTSMKAVYPDFDLNAEAQNPRFVAMLKSGVPVQTAYEALHIDDIKRGLAVHVAQATEKKVTDNVRAKGARPAENGVSSTNSAITYKSDVSSLSKADRQEIARRVARGELIDFK